MTARDRAMRILPLSCCCGPSIMQNRFFAGGSIFLDNRFMYPQVVLDAMGTQACTGFANLARRMGR